MKQMYEENEEFREYVDRFAASRGITVDIALTYAGVRIVAETYRR